MRERWTALMGSDAGFDRLVAAYGESHRAYHNFDHILDLLAELDSSPAAAGGALEIAIWYHDVVYDPRAKDNEARSAAWAVRDLEEFGFADSVRADVERLILATRHNFEVLREDGRLVVSLDLSTLGKPRERYQIYAAAIRREYGWVPESDFAKGRASVLRGFLDRPHIFPNAWFRERYEDQARENLKWELASLERGERAPENGSARGEEGDSASFADR